MTTRKRNEFLDIGSSDEGDSDRGYDSEAAEETKGKSGASRTDRISKRRKLDLHSDEDNESGDESGNEGRENQQRNKKKNYEDEDEDEGSNADAEDAEADADEGGITLDRSQSRSRSGSPVTRKTPSDLKAEARRLAEKNKKKKSKTGVIYLSSLPPYLKPSALKSLLVARGFGPITKVFLTPYVPPNNGSTKRSNRRKTYTDGWVEFESKRTAKVCAESLNATIVGGKKGGWYHDDVWNMKYLRGFKWADLMEQVQRERGEREAKRRIEDARARKEEKAFMAGVEKGKVVDGIRKKRDEKRKGDEAELGRGPTQSQEVRRVFRQNEVRGPSAKGTAGGDAGVDENTKRVLGKIF